MLPYGPWRPMVNAVWCASALVHEIVDECAVVAGEEVGRQQTFWRRRIAVDGPQHRGHRVPLSGGIRGLQRLANDHEAAGRCAPFRPPRGDPLRIGGPSQLGVVDRRPFGMRFSGDRQQGGRLEVIEELQPRVCLDDIPRRRRARGDGREHPTPDANRFDLAGADEAGHLDPP